MALAVTISVNAVLSCGAEYSLSIALFSGSVVAMSQCLILAARPRLLEPLFSGLDRNYRMHDWLGISAIALMIGQQLVEPHFNRWARESSIGELTGETGEFAPYSFIGLILVSWFKRLPYLNLAIPYKLWRLSHRLTGVLFAIVSFHQLFTDRPTAAGAALSLYLNTFCVAGLCAHVYTQMLASRLRRKEFEVSHIIRRGSVADVLLAPHSKPLLWKPGQFAFVSSLDARMSEPHPLTIASAPRHGRDRVRHQIAQGLDAPFAGNAAPGNANWRRWASRRAASLPSYSSCGDDPPSHSSNLNSPDGGLQHACPSSRTSSARAGRLAPRRRTRC